LGTAFSLSFLNIDYWFTAMPKFLPPWEASYYAPAPVNASLNDVAPLRFRGFKGLILDITLQ